MKLAAVTLALLTVAFAAERRPIAAKLTGEITLDTRAEGKDTKKPKQEVHKLAIENHVTVSVCDKKDLKGECLNVSAEFYQCHYMDAWTPNLAGKVTSLDVELGGLCWFYNTDKCKGEGLERFGLNGGTEKNLKYFNWGNGNIENLDNTIRSFYCTQADTTPA